MNYLLEISDLVLWFNALAGETKRFVIKPLNNTTFCYLDKFSLIEG